VKESKNNDTSTTLTLLAVMEGNSLGSMIDFVPADAPLQLLFLCILIIKINEICIIIIRLQQI
jgi:hypothetical protein